MLKTRNGDSTTSIQRAHVLLKADYEKVARSLEESCRTYLASIIFLDSTMFRINWLHVSSFCGYAHVLHSRRLFLYAMRFLIF